MLIAQAQNPLSMKLRISKETGFRPVELYQLRTKDVDLEKHLLYPATAKNGNPRTGKISQELTNTIEKYIQNHKLNNDDRLFTGSSNGYGKNFRRMRNKLANKLHDPTIKNIRLYDIRHYFATALYAKTRDILYVKQQMGHKHIENTLIYTQLLNLSDDEWTVKTATNIKEATQLLEAGFEYIQEKDGISLYRKRK